MEFEFSPEVRKELKYYVYRLVDPRDGTTFYVGKGKGNRVFQHVKMALKLNHANGEGKDPEDEVSAKYKQIQDIHAAGLKVICIIHRHHIESEKVAFEIEAALIEAYPGLTNIQDGHGNMDFGCANASEIQRIYKAEEAEIAKGKFVIIKVKESIVNARGSLYEAVRRAWRINVENAKGKRVLACVNGLIRGVFVVDGEWKKDEERLSRWYFDGREVDDREARELIGKRLPKSYAKKGAANPVCYS